MNLNNFQVGPNNKMNNSREKYRNWFKKIKILVRNLEEPNRL